MIPCQTYNKSNHVKSKIILQQIKRIESALDCQKFCSYYYADQCTWWLYDEKNNYCKIFKGPQQDIFDDCFELGFSSFPSISECKTVGDPHSNDNCQVNILIYIYSLCTSLKFQVLRYKFCIVRFLLVFQTRLLSIRERFSGQFGTLP